MPTYEYKCLSCDTIFEHFQSMKDEPLSTCLCEKKGEVKRLISNGGGIIFKGSGFYVNDYKPKSPESSQSETKSESKTGSTGSGTESKP
ncbi:MAG: zinc ribbon domain-containing protein [Leptospiraceae bacterium]|nr:zinc ribbon domain-containing protein [Leptospiraceae bacterium]MCP5500779.1 zinc ribbon domain-containing protein [Leptospiraceae bacterium]